MLLVVLRARRASAPGGDLANRRKVLMRQGVTPELTRGHWCVMRSQSPPHHQCPNNLTSTPLRSPKQPPRHYAPLHPTPSLAHSQTTSPAFPSIPSSHTSPHLTRTCLQTTHSHIKPPPCSPSTTHSCLPLAYNSPACLLRFRRMLLQTKSGSLPSPCGQAGVNLTCANSLYWGGGVRRARHSWLAR